MIAFDSIIRTPTIATDDDDVEPRALSFPYIHSRMPVCASL